MAPLSEELDLFDEELTLETRQDHLLRKRRRCDEVDPRAFMKILVKAMKVECQHLPVQMDIAVCRLRQVKTKADFVELWDKEETTEEICSSLPTKKVQMHLSHLERPDRKQREPPAQDVHHSQERTHIEHECRKKIQVRKWKILRIGHLLI